MKINNMPEQAKEKKVMVVRIVNGEAWFYGAWDDMAKAAKAAAEVGGMVIQTGEAND